MDAAQVQNKRLFLPDLADIIFVLILYLTLYVKPDMIFADGSTGWHLVCGNYIWQHHQVPYADILSYTCSGKPWVDFEWLSDLLMSGLVNLGGQHLLTVMVSSAIAWLFFLLYKYCRENGCNFLLAIIFTVFGALLSAIHWLARPHIFTFFGIYIFYKQLDSYYCGKLSGRKLTIYLSLYMLLWVNCHPGFLFGLALLFIYLISLLAEYAFIDNNKPGAESKKKLAKMAVCLFFVLVFNMVITLFNPYGTGIYNIFGYFFKNTLITQSTDEFLSPVFHGGLQPSLLELFFTLFIIGLAIKKKIKLPDLLVYLVFAHMALSAKRHMSIFVIVALPIISRLYANTVFDPPGGTLYAQMRDNWRNLITKISTINSEFSNIEKRCSFHLLPIFTFILLVLIAFNNGKAFGITILHDRFPENSIPNKNLTIIKQLNLDPVHGMSLDNWGGIIKYKLNYPVFVDDRSDFYGEQFFSQYGVLIQAQPGWQKILDKYQINWLLLPPNNRLTCELKADHNWRIAAEDKASLLLVRVR